MVAIWGDSVAIAVRKRPQGILLAISMRKSFFDFRLLSDIDMGLSLATILVAGGPLKC